MNLRSVWNKAIRMPGYDPSLFRADRYGNVICFYQYGNRQSPWGWEIDHIYPQSRGGSSRLANLQPLHWRNNVRKSNHIW